MLTERIMLVSGVPAVVREITAKHQRILTQKSKKSSEGMNEVIADLLESVGSIKVITPDFAENMLACDRKRVLVAARQLAVQGTEFENTFLYEWEYTSAKTNSKEKHKVSIDLTAGFPVKHMQKLNGEGVLEDVLYQEYDEIQRKVRVQLPRSGETVEFTLLDGIGEKRAAAIKNEEQSSHSTIETRNPVRFVKTERDVVPVVLRLDTVSLLDVEHLRKTIRQSEGQVDTEFQFEHPEKENTFITLDLTRLLSFFYLSGTI